MYQINRNRDNRTLELLKQWRTDALLGGLNDVTYKRDACNSHSAVQISEE